ncbi:MULTISPECIES: CsbD family protein [unclassified Streptomyces]|uniref:CsbD family protein n=1 Tax=unclassified Streptomyces TaxID=2593676 RepID=UPI00081F214A|nr:MULTISPECIES: CsbD family protein [unclassified Streptomyces]MYR26103.1 CsbD family protein [Streptomyces sp. SID4945]SCD35273.1 CsbD-like [Streptomyces sp. TverLS-915]SCE95511.1 CsbD-like [Streptomyces sp. LcepLS]
MAAKHGKHAHRTDQKATARAERVKGAVKETAGKLVGNERLQAEGGVERSRGDMRQAKEKAKDAFRH